LVASPNGKFVATAGEDGRLFVWDLSNSRELWRMKVKGPIRQIRLRPRDLLDCRVGEKVLTWNFVEGKGGDSPPADPLLAPRASLAVRIAKSTPTVPSGTVVLAGGEKPPCIDFHPTKDILLAMTPNGPMVVGTQNKFRYEVRPTDLSGRITYAILGEEGEAVFYGAKNGQVYIDRGEKIALQMLGNKIDGAVAALALSDNGKQLVAGSEKGQIVLYDL